jgi:hypothetical protein
MSEPNFNLAQLATWEDARECAHRLTVGPIAVGWGVLPETNDAKTSGIYVPDWLGGPTGFPAPHYNDDATGKKYLFLHFRFRNGAQGMNVGLIMDKFRRYPNSPAYVLEALGREAEQLASEGQ